MDERRDIPEPGARTLVRRLGGVDPLAPVERVLARLVAPNALALAAVFALSVVVLGPYAFDHLIARDDWGQILVRDFQYDIVLSHGRWLHFLTLWALGGDLVAPSVSLFAMVALWWLALLHLCRVMDLSRPLDVFLVLAVFTMNPVMIDMIGFETNHLAAGLAVLAGVLSGTTAWALSERVVEGGRRRRDLGLLGTAAALFAVAAAGFQQFALLAPMGFAVLAAARLAAEPAREATGRRLAIRAGALAASAVLGFGLYVILAQLTWTLSGESEAIAEHYDQTGGFIENQLQANAAARRFASAFAQFLFLPRHGVPWAATIAFLGLLAVLTGRLAGLAAAGKRSAALAVAALVGTLLVTPWLLGLVRLSNVYYYSALSPLALTWAGVLAVALAGRPPPLQRGLAALAGLVLVAVSAQQIAAAAIVTKNHNRRDLALASELATRAEALPDYARAAADGRIEVFVFGGDGTRRGDKPFALGTPSGPLSTSAAECGLLPCTKVLIPLAMTLMQSRAVDYRPVRMRDLTETERTTLGPILDEMAPWPAPSALRVVDGRLLVIRLP